jgi:hypothetical protein
MVSALNTAISNLAHKAFEMVEDGDYRYFLSIDNRLSGERIWIKTKTYQDQDNAWLKQDGVLEWKMTDSDFELPPSDDLVHVLVEGAKNDGTNIQLKFDVVMVNPSPYPKENISLHVYKNAADQFWGIGEDKKGQLHTFFKKKDVFGDYWICSAVNSSKAMQQRIDEKYAKGYKAVGSNWMFRQSINSVVE